MTRKEKQENTINKAWNNLYKRIEQNDLLPNRELSERNIFKSVIFRWAVSVAVLCGCFVLVWFIHQNPNIQENKLLVLHNEINVPTLATALEDGSIVYLSEQAVLQYPKHFHKDKRIVTLQGNAFFEISKQHERPFIIDTELAEIEVLGTFFHVQSDDKSSFLLSVRNGEVKVTLKKNNQTMCVRDGEAASLQSDYLQIINANWHLFDNCFEKIHFKDERLADIARIINQNSTLTQIEISPELENKRLTTTFSGETPEMMAELICMALNLTYSQRQNIIYITK